METPEQITGQKISDLLAWLETSRRLVKISLPRKDFDRLTLVTRRGKRNGSPAFAIDPPEGLIDAASAPSKNQPPTILFEFSGEDGLLHRFETPIVALSEQQVWLRHPEEIQRYQMRDNFRIKAPSNAELIMQMDDSEVRMAVDNISLGGMFCICSKKLYEQFSIDMPCYRLSLIINLIGQSHTIPIDRAVVRRIEKGGRPNHFGIAFQFKTIKSDARKQLTTVIYDLQRQFLKNRLQTQN